MGLFSAGSQVGFFDGLVPNQGGSGHLGDSVNLTALEDNRTGICCSGLWLLQHQSFLSQSYLNLLLTHAAAKNSLQTFPALKVFPSGCFCAGTQN